MTPCQPHVRYQEHRLCIFNRHEFEQLRGALAESWLMPQLQQVLENDQQR